MCTAHASIFTAGYAVARCLSVRLSVYLVETAQRVIKLFSPSGSHAILVLLFSNNVFFFEAVKWCGVDAERVGAEGEGDTSADCAAGRAELSTCRRAGRAEAARRRLRPHPRDGASRARRPARHSRRRVRTGRHQGPTAGRARRAR